MEIFEMRSENAYRLATCVKYGFEQSARFYAGCIIADGFAQTYDEMVSEHFRWTETFSKRGV